MVITIKMMMKKLILLFLTFLSVILSQYVDPAPPYPDQPMSSVCVLCVIREPRRWEDGGSGVVLMACRLLRPDHIHSLPPPQHHNQLPLPLLGLLCFRQRHTQTHTPQNGCINFAFFTVPSTTHRS